MEEQTVNIDSKLKPGAAMGIISDLIRQGFSVEAKNDGGTHYWKITASKERPSDTKDIPGSMVYGLKEGRVTER